MHRKRFLSTPSARRATKFFLGQLAVNVISIHALREEGDSNWGAGTLSIAYFYPRPPRGGRQPGSLQRCWGAAFLSTPSARRATVATHCTRLILDISIHALREEGDGLFNSHSFSAPTFLSTPSARRATPQRLPEDHCKPISIHALREEGDAASDNKTDDPDNISIHALREEGDGGGRCTLTSTPSFLSTPSARRATKAAVWRFVYSEYFYPRPPRGGRR